MDNFAQTNKGQTLSDLIRHGIELSRQEQLSDKNQLAKKRMSLAGSTGSTGDPLAWSKINDIYDL